LIIGYWLLLKFTSAPGFPHGDLTMEGNFASYVDRTILPGHLYLTIHDPEGMMSTIPAISTGLLGILTGNFLKNNPMNQSRKVLSLLITGVVFLLLAQLWNLDCAECWRMEPLIARNILLCYRCSRLSKMGLLF